MPIGHGWVWNQVIMDLGASLCRPRPHCEQCPLATTCAWNAADRPEPDPAAGSAGVSSRQAPFAGSDRQKRGDVLRALGSRPRPAADFDGGIVEGLVADGLVVRDGDTLALPG